MSITQGDLFADPPPPRRTRAAQILDLFEKFHLANPQVWNLFLMYALKAVAENRENYSSKTIVERIRWHQSVHTTGSEVKIGNNFTAYYARLFELHRPDLAGFFRMRRLISEDKPASDNPEYINWTPAGDERIIQARLSDILKRTPPPPNDENTNRPT
jgi:hypothetical protein